jgi:uncharacterized membrane protein YciS (DUF1049 family)
LCFIKITRRNKKMKCKALVVLSIIFCAAVIGAQEKTRIDFPYTLGAGAEYGLNTRENFALGYTAAIDRVITGAPVALGVRGTMYNDQQSVTLTEAEATVRLNLISIGPGDIFTQLGLGWSFYREDDREANTYTLDVMAGYKFFFLDGFYVEPFVRVGYPYQVNMGLLAGHWFSF